MIVNFIQTVIPASSTSSTNTNQKNDPKEQNQLLDEIADYMQKMAIEMEERQLNRIERLEQLKKMLSERQVSGVTGEEAPSINVSEFPILPHLTITPTTPVSALRQYLDDQHKYYAELFTISEALSGQLNENAELLRLQVQKKAAPEPPIHSSTSTPTAS